VELVGLLKGIRGALVVSLAGCGADRASDESVAVATRAPSEDAITATVSRPQRPLDVPATAEVQGLAAGDIDFEATRSPSGLRERLILVPTHTVKDTCDADPAHEGPPGVCVIRGGARGIPSR
jgi:hypothetical protein